jgi:hypothetical protein
VEQSGARGKLLQGQPFSPNLAIPRDGCSLVATLYPGSHSSLWPPLPEPIVSCQCSTLKQQSQCSLTWLLKHAGRTASPTVLEENSSPEAVDEPLKAKARHSRSRGACARCKRDVRNVTSRDLPVVAVKRAGLKSARIR